VALNAIFGIKLVFTNMTA